MFTTLLNVKVVVIYVCKKSTLWMVVVHNYEKNPYGRPTYILLQSN